MSRFWEAARELDPEAENESDLAGSRMGDLAELLHAAALKDVEDIAQSMLAVAA